MDNLNVKISSEERRQDISNKNQNWDQYLNPAQIYTLGRLRNFGYDLQFVRYNDKNLAIFSQDKNFENFITVNIEGDFEINPKHINIRK